MFQVGTTSIQAKLNLFSSSIHTIVSAVDGNVGTAAHILAPAPYKMLDNGET